MVSRLSTPHARRHCRAFIQPPIHRRPSIPFRWILTNTGMKWTRCLVWLAHRQQTQSMKRRIGDCSIHRKLVTLTGQLNRGLHYHLFQTTAGYGFRTMPISSSPLGREILLLIKVVTSMLVAKVACAAVALCREATNPSICLLEGRDVCKEELAPVRDPRRRSLVPFREPTGRTLVLCAKKTGHGLRHIIRLKEYKCPMSAECADQ
jgi:hypothetical protein